MQIQFETANPISNLHTKFKHELFEDENGRQITLLTIN